MGIKRSLIKIENRLVEKVKESYFTRRVTRLSVYSLIREKGLELVYLFIIFSLVAGVVNTILEGSRPEFAGIPILTTRSAQTWSEAVMNFFIMMLGTAGIYMIYQSGRQATRRRVANLYLLLGLTILVITIFVGIYIIGLKR